MAQYTIFVIGEDDITLSGGAILDGVSQGDGSHLVADPGDPPITLTINNRNWQPLKIDDGGNGGADSNFADNDGNQRLAEFTPGDDGNGIDGVQQLDGVDYADGTRIEAEYRFVMEDPNTGIQYEVLAVNINNSNPSFGTVEALAFVDEVPPVGTPLTIISAQEGPSNSGANAVEESTIVPICFVAGTRIATPTGEVAVEDLCAGDAVLAHDGRELTLAGAYRNTFSYIDQMADPRRRPVTIVAGALGGGLPRRDLSVSRQHRMLVSSKVAERMFGVRDVLIPAHKLCALPGIHVDTAAKTVTYVHLLFERHEVILAEGAPSESLFTGPEALKAVSPEAREEILCLFPQLCQEDNPATPAHMIPEARLQKQLVARHARNRVPLLT